jgi:putative endopeptidase
MGVPAGFVFRSVPDAKRSARTIAEVYQGGLGLPDRDYYLKPDSASAKIRREYVGHVARMLQLSGLQKTRAERSAAEIMRLETALASGSMTKEAQRDPEAIYHLTRINDLQKATPGFGLDVVSLELGP